MTKPYITVKFAQTLDGKIAAPDGSSKWISGPEARKFAHGLRARSDAVLVGIRTVLLDNPSLTTRLVKGKNPARVIIDRKLRVPLDARLVRETNLAKTIIITTPKAPIVKMKRLKAMGVEIIVLPASKGGDIDLRKIIRILYKKGIKKILVEGGSRVISSFLKARLADEVITVISPKILGRGTESVGDMGIKNIKNALGLRLKSVKRLGKDIIYTAAGFTVFEILVVVTIVGLLSMIAIPNYMEARINAARSLCQSNQKMIFTAAAGYVLNETDSLADLSDDEQLDALVERGYLRSRKWQSCPSTSSKNSKDYILIFGGDSIIDVDCKVKGSAHQWP
ncbi:MAG: bifunctional diaminohydroxyphosphoribosylaminopyrimidine deaminase/5-amino-6-(5-phosphoribosylamino)uracil reductase RibD [Candidatus Omnitrophota bacterium]